MPTQKQADYLLFRKAVLEYIKEKKHLVMSGIEELVCIRASINLGLGNKLKESFPEITPFPRPIIDNQRVPHGMWMAGFCAGEGSFTVNARLLSNNKRKINLWFKLPQHIRDANLIKGFIQYFDGKGTYTESLKDNMCHYNCESLSHILDKIIPFFNQYPIIGVKSKNFADFVLVANLMKGKAHLTAKGFEQILLIKDGMNKGRKL